MQSPVPRTERKLVWLRDGEGKGVMKMKLEGKAGLRL